MRPEKTYELSEGDQLPSQKHILVLEDEVDFAFTLKEGIQTQGYQVTVVSSGAEGLKKILLTDFSVILCDMVMPNFPGDMFYLAAERACPHLRTRFIFMTGHQGDRKIEQFIRNIRGLILWKPFEMSVLFDVIKGVIGKNEGSNPGASSSA